MIGCNLFVEITLGFYWKLRGHEWKNCRHFISFCFDFSSSILFVLVFLWTNYLNFENFVEIGSQYGAKSFVVILDVCIHFILFYIQVWLLLKGNWMSDTIAYKTSVIWKNTATFLCSAMFFFFKTYWKQIHFLIFHTHKSKTALDLIFSCRKIKNILRTWGRVFFFIKKEVFASQLFCLLASMYYKSGDYGLPCSFWNTYNRFN